MKLYIKYNLQVALNKILKEQLDKLGEEYSIIGAGEVEFSKNLTAEQNEKLITLLGNYGMEIIDNHKNILVQKMKEAITELVYLDSKFPSIKISSYLSEKFNHSYGYLGNLFSELTYTTIENFIIMQKIERVKQLMTTNELTLTEISYKLNYSSLAHLSGQSKKSTGMTPSVFQRIIKKRRKMAQN